MEQVQKTADELRNQNFIDIQTFENLRCTYSVKNQIFPEFDFNMNGLNKSEPNNNNNKRKKKKMKVMILISVRKMVIMFLDNIAQNQLIYNPDILVI